MSSLKLQNKIFHPSPPVEIGIIGNPNSGKTTLFNALTGARQRVGNWPGVTVEQKVGKFSFKHQEIKLVDLPGTYSLVVASDELSLDERIACDYIASGQAKLIVNVIDASNLERNLYLTLQLLEQGVPVVIALNMIDVAKKKHIQINEQKLSKYLGCPVVALEAVKKKGIAELKAAMVDFVAQPPVQVMAPFAYPAPFERAVDDVVQRFFAEQPRPEARSTVIRLFEEDVLKQKEAGEEAVLAVTYWQNALYESLEQETDVFVADARYGYIADLVKAAVKRATGQRHLVTSVIDNIVLNRFLGIPIFLLVMYSMFLFAINLGGVFQDFFDISSDALFVQAPTQWLQAHHVPGWITVLLAEGIGKGINTVVTFVPVIFGMFFFLAFIEQTGYMARAAFVVDRLMRAIGLPGKSFVPMIVGFGCNVPAVLAARTLENRRDRVLTALMSPFMSCGARLAIFAVFTAAFFPTGGASIVFVLYLIGVVVAILTGLILRKTILRGDSAPFVLELPVYHLPTIKSLWLHTWHRLRGFVLKAGKLIVPICVLLGVLNALSIHGGLASADGGTSLLAAFGQFLTPVFAPIGIHQNNWPATVGLLSGVLAKEVVVGTLNSLYGQAGALIAMQDATFHLGSSLVAALTSIPENFTSIGQALWNPIAASSPGGHLSTGAMGQMYQRFDGQVGAFAYLLFVLLYFPCVSTTAAMSRELGKRWAWFSAAWTTAVAYGFAVLFYQLFTFMRHPLSSVFWVLGVMLFYTLVFVGLRIFSLKDPELTSVSRPIVSSSACSHAKAAFRKKCGS